MGIVSSSASPEVSDPDDIENVKLDLSQSLPHDAFSKVGKGIDLCKPNLGLERIGSCKSLLNDRFQFQYMCS